MRRNTKIIICQGKCKYMHWDKNKYYFELTRTEIIILLESREMHIFQWIPYSIILAAKMCLRTIQLYKNIFFSRENVYEEKI